MGIILSVLGIVVFLVIFATLVIFMMGATREVWIAPQHRKLEEGASNVTR